MSDKPRGQRFLNIATGVVACCAVLVAAIRVREAFFTTGRDVGAPVHVSNWRQYGTAGIRMRPSSARVTIVEFSDFQCPFCRTAARYLRDLRSRYPSDVAVVYRHYPLHEFAAQAALASECAAMAGAFEPIHDLFFAQGDSIGEKPWTRFALDVGVQDTVRFAECMRGQAAALALRRDTIAATQLGVHGTPTFLINDLQVAGYPGPAILDGYVEDALEHSKQ